MAMDPDKKSQIKVQSGAQSGLQIQDKAQVRALLFDKVSTEVSAEYSNYSNVFSAENAAELPENTRMNEHAIKLEEGKQSLFGFFYSLGPVELETLKTYIKTNLANGFIRQSKSPAGAPILFDQKSDRSLRLCMDYWGKTDIRYPSLGNLLIDSAGQGNSPNWICPMPIIGWGFVRVINGRQLSGPKMVNSSIRSCLLACPMLQPYSKDMLIRFWLKS